MVQLSALSMAAVSVVALAAVGGGVSYAAKDAEPGDLLYSVHTSIYGDASVDAEEEMNDMQKLHDNYLKLEADGEFDADARADLLDKYELHFDAVEDAIVRLEAKGKTEQAATLRTMLNAKAALFNRIMTHTSGSSSSDSSASSEASSSSSEDDDEDEDDNDSSSSHGSLRIESHDSASAGTDSESNSNVNVDVNADASATVNVD